MRKRIEKSLTSTVNFLYKTICHSNVIIRPYIPLSFAGRALEDLRASLFNQFNFSDGSKRQQRRICGPATALTFNFLVAVGIIFVNKMVRFLSFLPSF